MAAAPKARYQLLREVGRGSYGVVFEAQLNSSGARVAVKRMPCLGPETAELALHEFWALRSVRGQHRNLVRLEEAVLQHSGPGPVAPSDFQLLSAQTQQQETPYHRLQLVESCLQGRPCCPPDEPGWTCAVWFVMEFCDSGTMNDYLLGCRGRPEPWLHRRFMAQLASATAYLHRSQIVHRDLKPDNILVCSGGQGPQLKVADFGLSKVCQGIVNVNQHCFSSACGSDFFMAPEVWVGRYTAKADIFALGIIFWAMIERITFREEDSEKDLLGDSAYALSTHMLTSLRNPVSRAEERYNRSHSSTRGVIERTFGILKSRFRCLDKSGGTFQYSPGFVCKIVAACCILHNIATRKGLHIELSEDITPPLSPMAPLQLDD